MMKKSLRLLGKIDAAINSLERWSLIGGIFGMTLVSIANVIMRNIFGQSLTYADELNQAFIVLVTFIGIGYAARAGRHIRMTAFYDQLPDAARRWLMVFIASSTAVMLALLCIYSVNYVMHMKSIGSVTPSLEIPLYLVYLVVPAGLGLGAVQYLLTTIRNITADTTYLSWSKRDEYEKPSAEEVAP